MRYWVASGALAGAWLVFACGSAQNTGPGLSGSAGAPATAGSAGAPAAAGTSSAAPIALQDLCPIFTRDLCTYFMQCGGARYRDAAHCERELTCYGLPELTAAAARGAIDYDPSKVGACHERFAQSPCTFGFFLVTPNIYDVLQFCPGTVTPKAKAGDECSANGECSAGLFCNKGAKYTCPGSCKPFLKQGEDCRDNGRCADGLRCDSQLTQCVPIDAPGSSCTTGCSYSVTCPVDQVCPTNIWCDRAAGKCTNGRLEGEPCGALGSGATASTAECAVHLWCDALGSAMGVCRKTSASGGPCNNELYACKDGQHCVGYDPFGDAAGLGTCQSPGALGSACEAKRDCGEGLTCGEGHCQPPGGAQAACKEDVDCQSGLVCLGNQCTVALYPGDSCSSGVCTYSRCVNGTCDYHAKLGAACAAPTDCATGRCVGGLCYDDSLCKAPM